MKKIIIIFALSFLIMFSCGSNPTKSEEEKEAKADVNISWNQGSKYVYYSVFNTGEITITNFYIDIKVYYSGNIIRGRRFGNKNCEILSNKSYSSKFDASYQYGNATISNVILIGYGLNPEKNWMYD